jgi:hypothetical protein
MGSHRGSPGLGWGLLIIADLTDAFDLSARDGGTQVRMEFARALAA